MNNFTKRALTGAVFVIVLLGSAIISKYLLLTLFLVFTVVGTNEYVRIVNKKNNTNVVSWISLAFSVICYITLSIPVWIFDCLASCNGSEVNVILPPAVNFIIPLSLFVLVVELFRLKENGYSNFLHTIAPGLIIAIPFAMFSVLNYEFSMRSIGYNAHFAILFFISLWSNDTGAYLSGKAFGKHKLFPQISPNKTWEGSIGGALLAILGACIYSSFLTEITIVETIIVALIVVVFGAIGDLVQSMLKRNHGVKDSGTFIPGHGGVLDRFDSLLLAAPTLMLAYEVWRFIQSISIG